MSAEDTNAMTILQLTMAPQELLCRRFWRDTLKEGAVVVIAGPFLSLVAIGAVVIAGVLGTFLDHEDRVGESLDQYWHFKRKEEYI